MGPDLITIYIPYRSSFIHLFLAPKGHSIRIDFRDDFHIEDSSNCRYDSLELRDGPFGYSSLFGRYCGKNHPAMIESSGQYIWMRFQSDDIIQYSGFKAVYEFYPTPASVPGTVLSYFMRIISIRSLGTVCVAEL